MNIRKYTAISFIIGFLFLISACGNSKNAAQSEEEGQQMTMKGKLDVAGMSTYMYGTHKFYVKDTYYAVRSDKYDLNEYVEKVVTIVYTKVDGYPVEGGPEYLEIIEIRE